MEFEKELRVFCQRNSRPAWKKWKYWTDCTQKEKDEANLRTIWPFEVVLDFETRDIWKKSRPDLDKYSYEVWYTGSRGEHVHIDFPNLALHQKETRNRFRKEFLKLFPEADPCKSSENTLISFENRPHHKTGKNKRMVFRHSIVGRANKLPPEILARAMQMTRFKPTALATGGGMARFLKDPLVRYVLEFKGKIPPVEGVSRHVSISKNLGALAALCGLSEEDVTKVSCDIANKMEGKGRDEVYNWWKWMLRNGPASYNREEIIRFLKKVRREKHG